MHISTMTKVGSDFYSISYLREGKPSLPIYDYAMHLFYWFQTEQAGVESPVLNSVALTSDREPKSTVRSM